MSPNQPPNAADAPSGAVALDSVCARFEGAWRRGPRPPRIEDFLACPAEADRLRLLCELVRLDNYHRRETGSPRPLADYLRDFPELAGPGGRVPQDLLNDFPGESRPEDPGSTAPEHAGRPAPSLDLGLTRIGRYVAVTPLDGGGQAQVFRATHPTLGKEVVIKLSRLPLAKGGAVGELLAAEGRILAGLEHPNLAHVYDLDVHEGRAFLVMEYVRGRTLDKAAREERYRPRQAAAVVAQVARAVAAAHRQGVIHQDVKPKNILIDEAGRPRLIDFGMARLQPAWGDAAEGPSGGTPAYAAPEQARGQVTRVGPASDVFALGGVLYFLLTGQAPFAAESSAAALGRARRCDVDWAALRGAGAPRRLEAICRRAMAEEPADRYPTADALADALERFARRRWGVVAAAGAAALLLMAAGVWLARQPGPAPPSVHADLEVRVNRGQEPHDLLDAVPLHDGEDLQLHAHVPRGQYASLFLINGRGELKHLGDEPRRDQDRDWSYPPAGQFVRLEGPQGTEVFFLCVRPSAPVELGELQPLWDTGGDWPAIPGAAVLQLGGEQVKLAAHVRDLGRPHPGKDPLGVVQQRLEQFGLRLHERHPDITVAGVAFAHRE